MYGWRARIGLLVPSNNNVIEPEMYGVLPPGITAYSSMMMLDGLADDEVQSMEAQGLRAARELKGAESDVIMYACMGTAFAKEKGWGSHFKADAEKLTGLPCGTASLAMIEAMHSLGVKRLAVGTAYPEHVNARISDFLGDHGIEMVALEGLLLDMDTVVQQPPGVAYRLGRKADRPEADAVALFATDFRTFEIIDALERDLGKPVITTNQALLWQALQLAGVNEAFPTLGRLLAE